MDWYGIVTAIPKKKKFSVKNETNTKDVFIQEIDSLIMGLLNYNCSWWNQYQIYECIIRL